MVFAEANSDTIDPLVEEAVKAHLDLRASLVLCDTFRPIQGHIKLVGILISV